MPTKKKTKRTPVKKIEIREEWGRDKTRGWKPVFAYWKPNAETWSTGYARPFTARRGAERHFKDFIAKGGKIVFVNSYLSK